MNRFKDKTLRAQYDAATVAYETKSPDLFDKNGVRREPGSSFASEFWMGYDNKVRGLGWDAASKKSLAYAYWSAGRDAAREAGQNKKV